MKIYRENIYSGKPMEEMAAEQAISRILTPDPYSYGGQVERVQEQADLITQLLGRLLTQVIEKDLFTPEEVMAILGYGYYVGED